MEAMNVLHRCLVVLCVALLLSLERLMVQGQSLVLYCTLYMCKINQVVQLTRYNIARIRSMLYYFYDIEHKPIVKLYNRI